MVFQGRQAGSFSAWVNHKKALVQLTTQQQQQQQ